MYEFDLSDPDQRNQAAAQYALGTLDRKQKAQFEALLAVSHDLQAEVEQWREHLDVFNTSLTPVEPPARIWKQISNHTAPKSERHWFSWPSVAAFSMILVLSIGLLFRIDNITPGHQPEKVFVHLIRNEQQQPGWVVNASMEQNQLIIRSLRPVAMPEDSFYELWLMDEGQEPITLGFLPSEGERRIPISSQWKDKLMDFDIVVTMEGPDGAPSGYAMGPVSDKTHWQHLQF